MLDNPSEQQSIQKQFQDISHSLENAIKAFARISDSQSVDAPYKLDYAVRSLKLLQDTVSDQLGLNQHRLSALMGVGRVINSSLGLKRVLEEVVDSLVALMRAERGFLMLRDEKGELNNPAVARGIDHVDLERADFAFSRTIVKHVANSGEPVLTTNAQEDPRFGMESSVMSLQLRSILCVPMKLKGEIIGVMFVDNRIHVGLFNESDLELLSSYADQAAIAIYNARLFDDLQAANLDLEAANLELETAYEATLKGWVRALDLRDKETEGHTQRVTALTQELAHQIGFNGEGLVHITRGALLHDIGKMGIPDGILLKPGSLTAEERELMQNHPALAYEMLSPIEFLNPAIDIPYCHHEKWDGTGYPRGLHGEEIPLAARIFSVVDVWDALTSNRPYREPMPLGEVRQYIREQSGSHFDPNVVDAFLDLEVVAV